MRGANNKKREGGKKQAAQRILNSFTEISIRPQNTYFLLNLGECTSELCFSTCHFSCATSANGWSVPCQSEVYIRRTQEPLSVKFDISPHL